MTARVLGALLLLVVPAVAWAHGAHGGGATAEALAPPVLVGGYQVELLAEPGPPVFGRAGRLVARVTRDGAPVSGMNVRIAAVPRGEVGVPLAAPELAWAGQYVLPFTAARLTPHEVKVVLEGGDAVVFTVGVGRVPGTAWSTWLVLALVVGFAGAAVLVARLRARASGAARLDLLDLPFLRRLLASGALQRWLQIPVLALTLLVVFLGLRDVEDGGVNVATRLTWTIWWAGIIFTFVVAGRVWCMACPFGALNEWASRLAASARRLPHPFRNIWWATAMFVGLTWLDEQLGVVRSPRVTAWLVVLFAALAVVIGLFYARRSFCRYLCPIGGLIGIYSMTSPVELRAGDAATCRAHDTKECYRGAAHAPGCPMFEFPQAMDRNNYCNLCGQCVGACSRDNIVLRVRPPGRDLWASPRRFLDEAYLAVALAGLTVIVTAEMLTAWPGWIFALARWLPVAVRTGLKPVTYLGLVESVLLLGGTLVVAPLLVLGAAALSNRLAGEAALGVRRTFLVFAYMFIPVGLGMHLAHNLAHLLLEGGAIVPAIQRAVMLYTPFSLGVADWRVAPLASADVVSFLQMLVVVGFFVLSLVAGYRSAFATFALPRSAGRAFAPMAVLSLALTVGGIVLLTQPMGMRHVGP